MEQTVTIKMETITLGQLLKLVQLIDTGGAAKWFLQEYNVLVNGERETRRGRKLKDGDRVDVEQIGTFVVVRAE
ncbi:S4 domain-containing protein YaaA [Geobacillus stearothermophilus]|uniref:S4 domain-containing protein YaaA n=1 Tax=Geobacillus stearothermophilus TaxID=1422 RepID=UPI002E1DDA3B|nr:S4 domain-containing protein YaaA [Geobacillus stearothermophilus]MED3720537.1 S4 domain-containing protein YaaA [Geobacillus stearothermophilus]MED3722961.1 S4 domain-containing protein YaaA [Geobacillus stearothermophilus]MED3746713.1 S4 domain-containing protein YaaA [Geobacillus stearothermophilus]MED3752304.1 S4 domain-containing protein YaaA [Geobacillus stearothermophilus]MED3769436.1 S4 domain-containing protein YaaA [Geobacillus stearothermophilus]